MGVVWRERARTEEESGFTELFGKRSERRKGATMARKSAYDDLLQTTLGRVAGLWGKLSYLAGLRSAEGGYKHWGFERVHGPATAQDTFAQAHQSLIGKTLRSRLKLLRDDLAQSSGAAGVSPASYVSRLTEGLHQLLPSGCPKRTELHLVSILKTLSILAVRRQPGSQSSSQPPPPDRSLPPPEGA